MSTVEWFTAWVAAMCLVAGGVCWVCDWIEERAERVRERFITTNEGRDDGH